MVLNHSENMRCQFGVNNRENWPIVSTKIDLYAVGICMFRMLTQRNAFTRSCLECALAQTNLEG